MYSNFIMSRNIQTYYNLKEAVQCHFDGKSDPYIVAFERLKKDKTTGRGYLVFRNFTYYKIAHSTYKHNHEIMCNHKSIEGDISGRLVFDFDIPNKIKLPKKFKNMVELKIIETAENIINDVNTDNFIFVWSDCENPKKISKHLTVNGLFFETWIEMSQLFYEEFSKFWDESYGDIIKSELLVDKQIVRANATLRMVGCKKIGGNVLKLDDNNHTFVQSLIRCMDNSEKICYSLDMMSVKTNTKSKITRKSKLPTHIKEEDPEYDNEVYDGALQVLETFQPGVFAGLKKSGTYYSLRRIKSEKCLISGNIHDNENAYLRISYDPITKHYSVYFGCYRKCSKKCNSKYLDYFVFI